MQLRSFGKYKEVEINLSKLSFIDATSLTIFNKETSRIEKDGRIVVINVPEKYKELYRHVKAH